MNYKDGTEVREGDIVEIRHPGGGTLGVVRKIILPVP
jgi:hypothetical protein